MKVSGIMELSLLKRIDVQALCIGLCESVSNRDEHCTCRNAEYMQMSSSQIHNNLEYVTVNVDDITFIVQRIQPQLANNMVANIGLLPPLSPLHYHTLPPVLTASWTS